MKASFTLLIVALLCSVSMYSQRSFGQYSVEAGYGIGISGKPGLTDNAHFNIGGRYMFNEYWGVKGDFGHDEFYNDADEGVKYNRLTAHAIYNLGRYISLPDATNGYFNVLAHGGLGVGMFKSNSPTIRPSQRDTDAMGDLILGLTPQFWLSENLALHVDAAYTVHFSQHFNYSGEFRTPYGPKAFVGGQFNASIGLTLYLGRNRSDNDWR